jgi:hypothetical protein
MSDLVERVARPCTCHPSEAPVPCRKQYAFLDCIRAEARAIALEEAARVADAKAADERASIEPDGDMEDNAAFSRGAFVMRNLAAAIRAMIKD